MPFNYKKRPPLSSDMTELKKEIHTLNEKNISVVQQIHQGSSIFATISGGVANTFHLLGSIFSASRDIPVIGFFMQMFAMLPKSIEIISDPKKSIGEKVISIVFLATIVSLSIAAFIVGSLFAAITGTVVASIVTAIEGLSLVGESIEKYQFSAAYHKKIAFNELIDQKRTPENDQFNELFEARAVELQEVLKKDYLSEEEKEKLGEELLFIAEVLKEKNIIIGQNEKNSALRLQKLYQKREEKLTQLIDKIPLIKSTSVSMDGLSEDIQSLQNEMLQIDEKINKITASAEQLNVENMIATEKLFLSIGTFSTAAAGALLSIIGLMMVVSAVAMPPALLGAVVGIGIGLAAVSLGKFILEKIAEHQDTEEQEKKDMIQKETILEEALYQYEYQLQSTMTPSMSSSHAKHMKDLLIAKPTNEPSPTQSKTQHVNSSSVSYSLFSKPLTSPPENGKEQDATKTHSITPP